MTECQHIRCLDMGSSTPVFSHLCSRNRNWERSRDRTRLRGLQSPSEGTWAYLAKWEGSWRACPCSLNTRADEHQERRKMASDNSLCWHKNKEVWVGTNNFWLEIRWFLTVGEMLFWNRFLRGALGARHAISFKIEFEMDFITSLPAIAGKWDLMAQAVPSSSMLLLSFTSTEQSRSPLTGKSSLIYQRLNKICWREAGIRLIWVQWNGCILTRTVISFCNNLWRNIAGHFSWKALHCNWNSL